MKKLLCGLLFATLAFGVPGLQHIEQADAKKRKCLKRGLIKKCLKITSKCTRYKRTVTRKCKTLCLKRHQKGHCIKRKKTSKKCLQRKCKLKKTKCWNVIKKKCSLKKKVCTRTKITRPCLKWSRK